MAQPAAWYHSYNPLRWANLAFEGGKKERGISFRDAPPANLTERICLVFEHAGFEIYVN